MYKYLLFAVMATMVIVAGFVYVSKIKSPDRTTIQIQPGAQQTDQQPATDQPVTTPPVQAEQVKYYYPISNYADRLTKRVYGEKTTLADASKFICGARFAGYHNGDDLETTEAEKDAEVPIYAIADGTVKQVSRVGGYGGLIIIQHQLADQTVTADYGHVSLDKTTIKASDTVKAGQQISILGDACSTETDGERKHLHFGLHKGSTVDVKGYVKTQADLSEWLNPKSTLSSLGAR